MLIKKRASWESVADKATPEHVFFNRRRFLTSGGAALLGVGLLNSPFYQANAARASTEDLYPFPRNKAFTLERPVTKESVNLSYNNFYEFGSSKTDPKIEAQALVTDPWPITIDGLVEKPITLDIDKLLRRMPRESRLYRHRCVEAWSMTVPWSGFPLSALVDLARPLSSARFLVMETFFNPDIARGQKASWYPWPYVEALTMAEATNDLAFLATGAYDKPLAKQMGAPIRLAVPWKYGFKSIKSIVKFTFVETRPKTFWEATGPSEYGFWANVNPGAPHRRWSQTSERVLGTNERIRTRMFNGYAEQVSHLYTNIQDQNLYR